MSKPLRIFRSPITRQYYAARAYQVRSTKDGVEYVVITGRKDDVTDDIEAIVQARIDEHEEAKAK